MHNSYDNERQGLKVGTLKSIRANPTKYYVELFYASLNRLRSKKRYTRRYLRIGREGK